eukprot:TRINITY_DN36279_c0_g1_i1.p1 TRINITY_DN36279_c0_g1~~TRINITY_DN36279_c0_g1_i1.p1  ORF type:complete len:397 (+),score=58.74 TRINITY_DN36279_c0_g1_i1:198-1388(+)
MPPKLLPKDESGVTMRSRQEEITAENIMAKSNTWERATGERRYLTRERQQQEKMRYFQSLHQQLKHSVVHLYQEDLDKGEDYYFSPEWAMRAYRQRRVDLSSADPNPERISRIQDHTAELRRERASAAQNAGPGSAVASLLSGNPTPTQPGALGGTASGPAVGGSSLPTILAGRPSSAGVPPVAGAAGGLFGIKSQPGMVYGTSGGASGGSLDAAAAGGAAAGLPGSVRSPSAVADSRAAAARLAAEAAASSGVGVGGATPRLAALGALPDMTSPTSASGGGADGDADAAALTRIVASPAEFSSTVAMLQRTRGEVETQAQTIQDGGLRIPGPMELRRTITRIFANPRRAEEISRQEYERREKAHKEERRRQQHALQSQLQQERLLLEAELAQFNV